MNLPEYKIVKEPKRDGILFCMARVPGSEQLYAGSSDGSVHALDLAADEIDQGKLSGHSSYVTGVGLSGNILVSGSYDGHLIWWDRTQLRELHRCRAHDRWIRSIKISPDGKLVASVADDMVCRLWNVQDGNLLQELRGHEVLTPHHFPSMLYACAFSPDSKYVTTGDRVGHIVVWETGTGKSVATMEAPVMYTWDAVQRLHSTGGIRSLAFSPDGKLLVAGGIGKVGNIDHLDGKTRVEIFDWKEQKQVMEFSGDKTKGLIERLAFHPESHWLLAGGGDGKGCFLFIDLEQKKIVREDTGPFHIHDFEFNETGSRIYGVGHEKLAIWEAAT